MMTMTEQYQPLIGAMITAVSDEPDGSIIVITAVKDGKQITLEAEALIHPEWNNGEPFLITSVNDTVSHKVPMDEVIMYCDTCGREMTYDEYQTGQGLCYVCLDAIQ